MLEKTGWISYSITWNILNSVVFATLYPKLLHDIDSDYKSTFSMVNTITTLLSSLLLPLIGGVVDYFSTIKKWLIISEFLGIACVLCFLFIDYLTPDLQLGFAIAIYLVVYFFLRIAVMNNNAMLAVFPSESRITLSLYSNFCGYGAALISLGVSKIIDIYYPLKPIVFICIFVFVATIIAFFSFFCPKDAPKQNIENSLWFAIKSSARRIIESFKLLQTPEYASIGYFLLSYFFYSTAGTIYTIFLTTIFLGIYDVSMRVAFNLNLFFTGSMVCGVIIGIIWSRSSCTKFISDIVVLTIHIIAFLVVLILSFVSAHLSLGITTSTICAVCMGILYGWNSSFSRGIMSKITPMDKRTEFFGFFSSFTYLGISAVSGIQSILIHYLPISYIFILMAVFTLPSFLFMILFVKSRRQMDSYTSLKEDDIE